MCSFINSLVLNNPSAPPPLLCASCAVDRELEAESVVVFDEAHNIDNVRTPLLLPALHTDCNAVSLSFRTDVRIYLKQTTRIGMCHLLYSLCLPYVRASPQVCIEALSVTLDRKSLNASSRSITKLQSKVRLR